MHKAILIIPRCRAKYLVQATPLHSKSQVSSQAGYERLRMIGQKCIRIDLKGDLVLLNVF